MYSNRSERFEMKKTLVAIGILVCAAIFGVVLIYGSKWAVQALIGGGIIAAVVLSWRLSLRFFKILSSKYAFAVFAFGVVAIAFAIDPIFFALLPIGAVGAAAHGLSVDKAECKQSGQAAEQSHFSASPLDITGSNHGDHRELASRSMDITNPYYEED